MLVNNEISCFFNRIEILCHDINVHIPHHISSRIPSYNLRAAHKSLQENWGKVGSVCDLCITNISTIIRCLCLLLDQVNVPNWSIFLYLLTMLLQYMNEATWNWRLMKTILTICHVYDKEQNYVAFDELAPKDSQPITFLKKVMPDYAWFSDVPFKCTMYRCF